MPKIDLLPQKKEKSVKAVKYKEPQTRSSFQLPESSQDNKSEKSVTKDFLKRDGKSEKTKEKVKKSQPAPAKTNFFKTLETELKHEIKSTVVGIYEIGDNLSVKTLLGEDLDGTTAERYFSLGETTIFINPLGIDGGEKYKNRLVTRFSREDNEYLLTVSSYAIEGICKKSDGERIINILRKVGEQI